MQTGSFHSSNKKTAKYIMKRGLAKSLDAPKLTATPQRGRGRGKGVRRPVTPVAGPSATVHVDDHDEDSEKENEPYEIESAEVEEEEEEAILNGSVAYWTSSNSTLRYMI